jgi:hypothetical protein
MSDSAIEQVRAICLALPEAAEKEAWGEPTFRVRNKIFAMVSNNHHGDGILAVWCKAPPGAQEVLIGADPARFYKPPYVGPSGWIGIRLEGGVDWGVVTMLIEDAYRMTAPKRLLALLPPAGMS